MKTTIIAALVVVLAGCGAATKPVTPKTPTSQAAPQGERKSVAQGDIKDGQSREGDIANADEKDTYDIDLGDATEFYLAEVQGDVDFQLVTREETSSKGNGLPARTSSAPPRAAGTSSPSPRSRA